ncbi:MAG: NAD(P)-dependent oxidoreductase [Victivallales bacterium]
MKILMTGSIAWEDKDFDLLCRMGHEIVFLQYESDSLPCPAEEIEMIICNGLFLHHPIEKFTALKRIQLTSAGFDRVPLDYIKKHDIKINNARCVYSIPMAEFAICGVLQLYKQSRFFYDNQKKHKWEKRRDLLELNGKTVCIVGCGSVGTECAKRFMALGCERIGVDIAPYTSEMFSKMLPLDEINTALHQSDIVILSLPLTENTRHLMNQERFEAMKPGAVLVNIARGAILDTASLLAALQTKLSGAVLDVFEEEPLSTDSELWEMLNVIVTPHNSFVAESNKERLLKQIMNNLVR